MDANDFAFNLLDAASYRLFGGEWRHAAKRKTNLELPDGGRAVMLSGLEVSDFGRCLITFSVLGDGVRELEVHSLHRTLRHNCSGWRLTQPVHAVLPGIETMSLCKRDVTSVQVLPRHYSQELLLVAETAYGLASCGPAYDVQYILNKTRTPDLLDPLLSTIEEDRHDFFFDGSRRYVHDMRELIAQRD